MEKREAVCDPGPSFLDRRVLATSSLTEKERQILDVLGLLHRWTIVHSIVFVPHRSIAVLHQLPWLYWTGRGGYSALAPNHREPPDPLLQRIPRVRASGLDSRRRYETQLLFLQRGGDSVGVSPVRDVPMRLRPVSRAAILDVYPALLRAGPYLSRAWRKGPPNDLNRRYDGVDHLAGALDASYIHETVRKGGEDLQPNG